VAFREALGNLWKIAKNVVICMFTCNKQNNTWLILYIVESLDLISPDLVYMSVVSSLREEISS